ncbi:hypothetical protein E4U23_000087 [Claviceps purpurea]|nr:hypothetical protein E4U23_000087 [Claviceps purpurea]
MPTKPIPIPVPPKPKPGNIYANPGIVEAPGSQYNGGVWCGSPKLVTTRLPSGEVVSVWGVPPKPGEETLPMLPPAKKPKDKKKKK